MTTMTAELDLAALGAAVTAALAEPDPEPETRIARRVTMYQAKDHFDAGGDVLVSERGRDETCVVGRQTQVHNARSTTWKALREQVDMWKNRYPNQRYYIVPTSEAKAFGGPEPEPTTHTPAPPHSEPAAAAEPEKPTFEIPKVEPHPTVMEAINTAVEKVLTGGHKATVEKRKALITALSEALAEQPIYGIELDGARLPIGDFIDLGNASIELDGYGRAATIHVDGGIPLWDVE